MKYNQEEVVIMDKIAKNTRQTLLYSYFAGLFGGCTLSSALNIMINPKFIFPTVSSLVFYILYLALIYENSKKAKFLKSELKDVE